MSKKISTKCGFFVYNFGTRNPRKSTKSSKGLYYGVVANKSLSHEMGSLDRPMTLSKTKKPIPITMSSVRNPKHKTNFFLF